MSKPMTYRERTAARIRRRDARRAELERKRFWRDCAEVFGLAPSRF